MNLILMRHGKAEERSALRHDAERCLTEKGKAKVREVAKGFACGFLQTDKIVIWSSPLIRALQTAEVLAVTLKTEKVALHEGIATGDLDGLARAWKDLPKNTTLIVVGHEPYLGLWTSRISGAVVPFKPATAAGFKLLNSTPTEANLRWFAHAGILADVAEENT